MNKAFNLSCYGTHNKGSVLSEPPTLQSDLAKYSSCVKNYSTACQNVSIHLIIKPEVKGQNSENSYVGLRGIQQICENTVLNSLGTPETRRRGRSTRKARRALTSNPPGLPADWPLESASLVIISRATLNNLVQTEWKEARGRKEE